MRRWIGGITLLMVATLLGACTEDSPDLHPQAADVLARWDAAVAAYDGPVLIPVGEPVAFVGPEPVAPTVYARILSGRRHLAASYPSDGPSTMDAIVTGGDGRTASVQVVFAEEALRGVQDSFIPCDDCTSVLLTAAHYFNGTIQTTRGVATIPLWEYRIDGDPTRFTVPAVVLPGPKLAPLPSDPDDSAAYLIVSDARGSITGQSLTVGFIGAPGNGDQPCGADYSAEAVESATGIAILLTEHRQVRIAGSCRAEAAFRTIQVSLSRPLGERAVLDPRRGVATPTIRLP